MLEFATSRRIFMRRAMALAIAAVGSGGLAACTREGVCYTGARLEWQRRQAVAGVNEMLSRFKGAPAIAAANAELVARAEAVKLRLDDIEYEDTNCGWQMNSIAQGLGFVEVQEILRDADAVLQDAYIVATQAGLVDAVRHPARRNWLETWWDISSP